MKRLKASATVEAAFIMPFVFFATMALIVLILMLYDRMKLKGDIRSILEYGRMRADTVGTVDEEDLKRIFEGKLSEEYLLCDVTEISVSVEGNKITASAVIAMRSPAGAAGFRMPAFSKVVSCTEGEDREQRMRIISAGKELIEKVVEQDNAD